MKSGQQTSPRHPDSVSLGMELLPSECFSDVAAGEKFGFGWCHLELVEDCILPFAADMGRFPSVKRFVSAEELQKPDLAVGDGDDEWGPWSCCLEEGKQIDTYLSVDSVNIRCDEFAVSDKVVALHVSRGVPNDFWGIVTKHFSEDVLLGARLSDLVHSGQEVTGAAEEYAKTVLRETTALNEDAAENYARLGDYMEDIHSRGGFKDIGRSRFVTITQFLASRWAGHREAAAAARLAASLVFDTADDPPWSPAIFEEAMESEDTEEQKQSKLLNMAGLVFKRGISNRLENRRRRELFSAWKADATAPAKAFCRAVGVDACVVDEALDRAVANSVPMMKWAAATLSAAALPAVKAAALLASGGAVTAAVVAASGLALDWYYEERMAKRLGPVRVTEAWGVSQLNYVTRAKELFSVGAAVSDELYDTSSHDQVIRIDPFFFSVKNDFSRLKDDSAAQRMLTNALVPPLIQSISSQNKTIIKLPGSISTDSASHIQTAMPEFYFKIVNRNHSHPELWAVRRGFEMMVARALVASGGCGNTVMIGANVRQVSKMPGVVANFGPVITGRDDFRHKLKGTPAQRILFSRLTIPKKFHHSVDLVFKNSTGVSFFSTQNVMKEDYIRAAIAMGIQKHYVAINVPVVMMDDRITEWEDLILGCRYKRRGNVISMSPLNLPVAGYDDSFDAVMSWVKPHRPFLGYDVTVSALAQVGSSYLLEIDIGVGPQESHDTIWKMPDAGHYVLHDLTRTDGNMHYYTVPAAKFDQTVKFVIQLSGAKNIVEATAGRMLGLEAQIKIGGTVLERSWLLTHREFSSTMVHAIVCAGLDKSDALLMWSRLRSHFSEHSRLGIWERVLRGYKKAFGFDKDDRVPPPEGRGASDFDVVTHWTSRQSSGSGFAEPFSIGVVGGDRGAKSSPTKPIVDEGYVSKDELDSDDAESVDSGAEAAGGDVPSIVERMTTWAMPKFEPKVDPDGAKLFSGFGPTTTRRQLVLDVLELKEIQTSARFDPTGFPEFGSNTGSLSGLEFLRTFASMSDVEKTLREKTEFVAPDVGLASILALAYDMPRVVSAIDGPLHRRVESPLETVGFMQELEKDFFSELTDDISIAVPQILVNGIAGSAKSSVTRVFCRERNLSCAVVCPTRTLTKSWRKERVGTCVTKHKLKLSTLRGRSLLVIDEVFAYTKNELHALLWKAAKAQVKVVALGDSKQQYEDGGEITTQDLCFYGIPTMRMCVSNTMPADAIKIARWAAESDPFSRYFQTRSHVVHSIFVAQKDQFDDLECIKECVGTNNTLVFKDRLGPELQYETISDEDLGFVPGRQEDWMSVSRTQGLRVEHSLLLTSRFVKAEKWFSDQPGLFYVATSRHSKTMLCMMDQYDLNRLGGLSFEYLATVEGRLSVLQNRERFDAPMFVMDVKRVGNSTILSKLAERGALPQTGKFRTAGVILENWRPWTKFSANTSGFATTVFSGVVKNLVGSQVPYVQTDAVRVPVYPEAMGLSSLRRPNLWDGEKLNTGFNGLDRLAVLQNSKDELLDQKNVIERTARPRIIDESEFRVRVQSDKLFALFKSVFLSGSSDEPLSLSPASSDWAESRTTEFVSKFSSSDPYGVTAFSVRSQGFLKTQTKVKLKRTFAMEENYGQTVLASPADFNAMFGPWSKMFLRNLRLRTRPGVVFDSGFSDKELAREFRKLGVLPRFAEENYQADVKRQDTSHTPVTLRVFKLLLQELGVPSHLADLYEEHSRRYSYQSMHAGLYRGEARYNLGSGDPFTLVRNIVEVGTVMIERFGEALSEVSMVIKGDDFLSDKILPLLPVVVPEIRATQLTEDFNKPPYHAGRFFLHDDIVPDPVRMVTKILVKRTDSVDRVNQLAESFYDRYVHLSDYSYQLLRTYVVSAYSDFEPEFPLASLDLYHALRDRTLFYELLCDSDVSESDKLVVVDSADDCAYNAARWFEVDEVILDSLRHEPVDVVEALLVKQHVPVYRVKGRPNDFLKRGIWLAFDHAWAVVGLTEYKLKRPVSDDLEDRHK